MREKVPSCVGVGFVALDVVQTRDLDSSERRFAGGSCGNVLTILAYLGWSSSVVARIGCDRPGEELAADLCRWSVDTSLLIREESGATPVVYQELYRDRSGRRKHRFSRYCPECGEKAAGFRPLRIRDANTLSSRLPASEVFYFDRVARGNLELARKMRGAGALVVFEPSGVRDDGLFEECLQVSHVFKFSHRRFDAESKAVLNARIPIVVETRGAAGLEVTVRDGGRVALRRSLPAVPAPRIRDEAGSGDWCTAGLIHGMVSGGVDPARFEKASKQILSSIRYAQAMSALNCAYEGARGAMYALPRERLFHSVGALASGENVDLSEEGDAERGPTPTGGARDCVRCSDALGLLPVSGHS